MKEELRTRVEKIGVRTKDGQKHKKMRVTRISLDGQYTVSSVNSLRSNHPLSTYDLLVSSTPPKHDTVEPY